MKQHWMGDALRYFGVKSPEMRPGTPIAEAWKKAEEYSGIGVNELTQKVAAYYRLGVADLSTADFRILKLVPEKLARRYTVFPLTQTDRQLYVATSNPSNIEAEQAIAFSCGRTVAFRVAAPQLIQDSIDRWYSPDKVVKGLIDQVEPELNLAVHLLDELLPEVIEVEDIEENPVIRLTNVILRDATREGASDIHIEPGSAGGVVRFRVDGVLRNYMQLPIPALNRLVSRIKVMAKVDMSDRLRPHDGRAHVQIEQRIYDLRLSTVPTRDSEKAVIRILDTSSAKTLKELAMPDHELGQLRKLLANREGLVLVTGPTGSGKTTTLYGALRELVNGKVNVTTIEDPIESELEGVTQIQVDPKRDVTFTSALRSILRQDPDVILVGEIRDVETAKMAIQAGMTGHLVLSTLHTNDAAGAVARLKDIGLDHANISATLKGIVAQRLLRRVCSNCAEAVQDELDIEEQRLASIYGQRPSVRARGCEKCGHSGYSGRLPIQEILIVNQQMQDAIARGASLGEIQQTALANGMRSMRSNALARVAAGLTTLSEIDRVLGDSGEPAAPAADSSPSSVLVVDDDAITRRLSRSLLEKQGYLVSEAADGMEALEKVSTGTYSLIILDLSMPRMDGRELLSRLRSSVRTAGIPVIVLTGSMNDVTEAQLMQEGADDYIRKPLDPARFTMRTAAALQRAAS